MSYKRLFQHAFLITYIVITCNAALVSYTFTKPKILPWIVVRYSYGMMAPYQGYSKMNDDLLAQGQKEDGTWEEIDLNPYYPMIRGNQVMYRRMRGFMLEGKDFLYDKYAELALLLMQHENNKGNQYSSVRLYWQNWPKSSKGFNAMRTEEHTNNELLTQVP